MDVCVFVCVLMGGWHECACVCVCAYASVWVGVLLLINF